MNHKIQCTQIDQISRALASPPVSDAPTERGTAFNQRRRIARQAAKEIREDGHANLGIGMPTLIPEYLPPGVCVRLQSENGAHRHASTRSALLGSIWSVSLTIAR